MCLASAAVCAAETTPSDEAIDLPEIVVYGHHLDAAAQRAATHDFVQSHGALSHSGQITRWRDPICVQVQGFSAEQNAQLSARIRSLADEVGAPQTAAEHCEVNVDVIATDAPQQLLSAIAASRPVLLGYHYQSQQQRLATVSQPIQAWYVTQTRGPSGAGVIDDTRHTNAGADANTRLSPKMSSDFLHALIVIDVRAIAGKSLGSIADYSAELVLSRAASPGNCSSLPTILDLFAANCATPAESLSEDDIAYLKALYQASAEVYADQQQSNIAQQMLSSRASRKDR